MIISKKLFDARNYEKNNANKILPQQRPAFHFTPYIGWMNDPNGFSFYNNKYHLFYQYNPYDTKWDSMHWGHAVSSDLLHWEYLPAALAPDMEYDLNGCFSGSSIEPPNGHHLLMYTGVYREPGKNKDFQAQCIATGNGIDYEKYDGNPVLSAVDLPKGMSFYDFRDPKIWRDVDGKYKCVVATCNKFGNGAILLYESLDAFKWTFCNVLAKNKNRFSKMWECPDFFEIEGKNILILSSQNMSADGFKHFEKCGVFCIIGEYIKSDNRFLAENKLPVDYGKDFYAPQTTVTPDGRRVMIGWLQNWSNVSDYRSDENKWFGEMSLPRELSLKDGKLFQKPISELEKYRQEKVQYKNRIISGDVSLKGVNGRIIDLELLIKPSSEKNIYNNFTIKFACSDNSYAMLTFYPKKSFLKYKMVCQTGKKIKTDEQKCYLISKEIMLKLRIILDKYSAEVFINDGEQVFSSVLLNEPNADKISFSCDGEAVLDVTKYTLG